VANEPESNLRPLAAYRALTALLADPDDTRQVFRIIDALSGRSPLRLTERFRQSPGGGKLLEERPQLLPVLQDRASLRAMPDDSLAHAYLEFLERENITADGLVDASQTGEAPLFAEGTDGHYVGERLRDTHDLWHTVTGYHADLVGESCMLAFTLAQTRNPGVGLVVSVALLKIGDSEGRRLMADAFRRGMRASWLPAVAWEKLLPLPLDEVRTLLNVGPPRSYETFRSHELAESGHSLTTWGRPARAA